MIEEIAVRYMLFNDDLQFKIKDDIVRMLHMFVESGDVLSIDVDSRYDNNTGNLDIIVSYKDIDNVECIQMTLDYMNDN